MDMIQISDELYTAAKTLQQGAELIFKYAEKVPEAKLKLRRAFAAKIIELKEQKIPATLIRDIALGDSEVSQLEFEHDKAELIYQACRDSLKAQQQQISALQSINKIQSEVNHGD